MRPNPAVVARTYLRLMVYTEQKLMGQFEVVDWVKDSLLSYRLPSEAMDKPEVASLAQQAL